MRCGVPATHVKNVIIWGNHSNTQYPDVHHCKVKMAGNDLACFDAVKDDAWLKGEFISVSWNVIRYYPCYHKGAVHRHWKQYSNTLFHTQYIYSLYSH